MDKTVIKTENLTKRFDTTLALNGLNLQIFPGEIYGLLGPNGAGKTTALKAIFGSDLNDLCRIFIENLLNFSRKFATKRRFVEVNFP